MDIPIVKVTLDHMRHEIACAVTGYLEDLKPIVKETIDAAVKNFDYKKEIRYLADRLFKDVVYKMLQDAFDGIRNDSGIRETLSEAIIDTLRKGLSDNG